MLAAIHPPFAPSPDLVDRLEEETVVFKINTLPLRECLLLDDLDKLRDGRIFVTMLQAAARTAEQHAMATRLLDDKLPSLARLQVPKKGTGVARSLS